jgi:hypothetical protein
MHGTFTLKRILQQFSTRALYLARGTLQGGGVVTEEQLANIDSVTQNWYILHDIFEIEEINPSDYLTTEDFKLMTYASLAGSTITGLSESAYNAIIAAGPKMAALVEKLEAEIEEREAKD